MATLEKSLSVEPSAKNSLNARRAARAAASMRDWFDVDLSLVEAGRGEWLHVGDDQPHAGLDWLAEACREVARRGMPAFIFDEDPCVVVALPLDEPGGEPLVALGTFLTRPVAALADLNAAAKAFGITPKQAATWAARQEVWRPKQLLRYAQLAQSAWNQRQQAEQSRREVAQISENLSATYEEISLLYRLTQNLKISSRDADLGSAALEGLAEVIPASGLAIQLLPMPKSQPTPQGRSQSLLLKHGECPLDDAEFTRLVEHLKLTGEPTARLVNAQQTGESSWPFAGISQLIVVPLTEGNNLFGWLAAFNQRRGEDFGSVEASLLVSVAAILGIHSGNIELYHQQSEFLAGVVHAMTSAIDAKDPYTCGHSDRVARVAVRLGRELNCTAQELNTLYLSGLLHDIGKIGVDDGVLRKPGKLTDNEYEHIKTHVEIGYRILLDLKQFDQILPVVRHHHEAWNGKGYPTGLAGENIPHLARIVAVADAFDAMSGDRPYRKGMPDDRLDDVLRAGAGKQWDPQVVEAFFNAREDIRQLVTRERDQLSLDVQQWS